MKYQPYFADNDGPEFKASKQGPEWFQRSLDQIGELHEVWNERLTFENLAERYLEGKLRVLVLWRPLGFGHDEQYLAVFQRTARRKAATKKIGTDKRLEGHHPCDGDLRRPRGRGYEKSVFVCEVKPMEPPKRVAVPPLYGSIFLMRSIARGSASSIFLMFSAVTNFLAL
jgi:hypothetical protein